MGQFLFHVPLRGNVVLLFGMAAIFLVGVLAMGMTISIVAKSQLLASQLAMTLTFLPSFLLSGFMFTIANMPRPIQMVTYLVPARYFVALLKGIYLQGRRAGNPGRRRRVAGRFRRHHGHGGQREVQEETDRGRSGSGTMLMFERIRQMLIKEFIQVFRDPRMRTVIFVIPCVQVLVIGYAVTTDVRHVPTAVWDLDNSTTSRELTARFLQSGYFDVVANIHDRAARHRDLIDRGEAHVVLQYRPRLRRPTCSPAEPPSSR